MSLKSILKEIKANRPQAEMEIGMDSPQTYGARVGLKRAAIAALERLRLQYRNELMSSTVFIVVAGAGRDIFSEVAAGEAFGCFAADPEALYSELASRVSPPEVNPSLFGRETVRNLFNIADNVLRDKASDLDIRSYPMLAFNDKYNSAVNTVEDFVPLLKAAINDQIGSEIVGINAVDSITDGAIKKDYEASIAPVVLNTADEKFALDLQKNLKRLTSKVFLVVAGKAPKGFGVTEGAVFVKTVSEESVGEALTTIRGKI